MAKMRKQPTLTVKWLKLAFWDDISEEASDIATKYLDEGETVTLITDKFYYRAPWADKPYYKVRHHVYGEGYVLAEAF